MVDTSKAPLYVVLAEKVMALRNCQRSDALKIACDGQQWEDIHEGRILRLISKYMPSGSGVDCGTDIDLDSCDADKLVFTMSFHHMDEHGGYDGWTDHKITIKPAFVGGFDMTISGRNRNAIKEYLGDLYAEALRQTVPRYPGAES